MITTLLFDFGDVFINLDKPATERGLKRLGLSHFSEEMHQANQAYEKGNITTQTFLKVYQNHLPNLQKKELIGLWNAILLDLPLYRLHFLLQLKKRDAFKILLLSNTNELHIDWIQKNVPHYHSFQACFDGFYLSHEIGMRKPNTDIFAFILNQHQLNPTEVLYIDDTKEHTVTAKKMGLHTWHLNPVAEDVIELFTRQKHFL